MSTPQPQDYAPPFINGAYEVAGYHVGKGLVDVFRNSTTSGKIRTGDYFFNRSRPLIQQYYPGLPNEDQDLIHNRFQKVIGAKEKVDSARGFRNKYLKAKEYEEVARYLFIIVETASRRAANQNLMAQISEAIAGRDTESTEPPQFGISSTHTDPFSDSHEASSLADVDVGNLDQVEMSIFQSETTGEAAVVLGFHGRDGSTQEVAGTIPFTVGSDDSGRTVETGSISSYDTHGYFGPPQADGDVGE